MWPANDAITIQMALGRERFPTLAYALLLESKTQMLVTVNVVCQPD